MECHGEHQRNAQSGWLCAFGAVLPDGNYEALQFHAGDQAPGTGTQAVYPVCACESGGHMGAGSDDGNVYDCTGHHF